MIPRTILTFEFDEAGDAVAVLDCGHRRHVRHRPPLEEHPWVRHEDGRRGRVGLPLECDRCARHELPTDAEPYRSTDVFDEHSLPAGLRRDHRTKRGTWARLDVLEGALRLVFAEPDGRQLDVSPGHPAHVPPELPHHVELPGPVRVQITFLRVSTASP